MNGIPKLMWFLIIGFIGAVVANDSGLPAQPEEIFGARPDNQGPIGGGAGYKNQVAECTYLVNTRDELLAALKKAKSGDVVYVKDDAEIDLTFFSKVEISRGVTLASGRGRNGSSGALIYTTQKRTFCIFKTSGEAVRITGLRLRGPEPERKTEFLRELEKKDPYAHKNYPKSVGVWVLHPKVKIDNCELWGWSSAAVSIWPGGSQSHIHHNYIHHCQLRGLGYGIMVSLNPGQDGALIEYNLFDWCRHCISSPGFEGCSYKASNNIVLENSSAHSFDMHGQWDQKQNKFVAGTSINIHHNTFKAIKHPAILIRGCPVENASIHHNDFIHITPDYAVIQRDCVGNMNVFQNVFGPEKMVN